MKIRSTIGAVAGSRSRRFRVAPTRAFSAFGCALTGRESVAVRWAASEVAAAGVGHGGHGGFDAALNAGPFGLAQPTEE